MTNPVGCKHCWHGTYYRRTRYKGTGHRCYNFDRSEADNTHIYDFISMTEGKAIYCENCDSLLGYFDEDEMDQFIADALKEKDND